MEKIDVAKMVRQIRDRQSKDTDGKSAQEVIEYFRNKAKELQEKAGAIASKE